MLEIKYTVSKEDIDLLKGYAKLNKDETFNCYVQH